jgi:hypothetical protein
MKQKNPPVDIRKVLRAAAEAALEEPSPATSKKPRLSTGRALLLGAGAITAGRLLARRGDGVLQSLQGRLAGLGSQPDVDEEELEDDEVLEEGPDAEADDDLEEELPEEDLDDAEEEPDEEPESNGGKPENRPRRRAGRGRS